MIPQVPFEQCAGKTVEAIFDDNYSVFIKFTDNTFTTVGASNGWDGSSAEAAYQPIELVYSSKSYDFDINRLIEHGIFTEQEVKDHDERVARKDEEARERRERESYEMLKAKFEKT